MDQLFLQFARSLFIIMILFGVAMLIVVLFGDPATGYRMVNVFGSMFVGVLGLGSGYILGRSSERSAQITGKEDMNDRT